MICEQGGDYFFVVKDNQKERKADIEHLFNEFEGDFIEETDAGHGRVETRKLWVLPTPWNVCHWLDCKHLCKIERTRYLKNTGKTSIRVEYAITSLDGENATPKKLLKLWRDHWKIENQLHWQKDNEFDEDRSTVRTGNAPSFLAMMRNLAVGLLSKSSKPLKYFREELAHFPKRSLLVLKKN